MSHKSQLTRRCLFSLPLAAAVSGQTADSGRPAVQVAAALKELAFDGGACWRVRDLTLVRQDVKVYLTDGFLMLSKPLAGAPLAAPAPTGAGGIPPENVAPAYSLAAATGNRSTGKIQGVFGPEEPF